jgi:hypothetical protein
MPGMDNFGPVLIVLTLPCDLADVAEVWAKGAR